MRFSQVIHKIFLRAQEEDAGGGNAGVTTEHILLGMLGVPEGDAWGVLSSRGIGQGLQVEIRGRLGIQKPELPLNDICVSAAVKDLFVASMELAMDRKEVIVRSTHLLAAMIGAPDDPAARRLLSAGMEKDQVLAILDQPSAEA